METFSLLKYWRGTSTSKSTTTTTATATDCSSSTTTTTTTPIITTASPRSSTSSSDNDEGPYFDLEFSLPDHNDTSPTPKSINNLIQEHQTDSEEEEQEDEFEEGVGDVKLSISSSSSSSYNSTKEHLHSDDRNNLFFNGHLVPIEATSTDSTPKFRNNLFKSASKFRVLMALKLKKLKENGGEEEKKPEMDNQSDKLFTVKFIKVEEAPVVSLFSRESSSKGENKKEGKGSNEKDEEEKIYAKDVMQRYLKMMKPLYVRASKRYGEKMRFSGQLMGKTSTLVVAASPPPPPSTAAEEVKGGGEVVAESVGGGSNGKSGVKSLKERNLTAGLRVVRRRLGKSKSASAVTMEAQPVSRRRRDDSLIQQEDGIQSAIMHCKRSFNSSRASSVLQRSSSHQQVSAAVAVAMASSREEEVV